MSKAKSLSSISSKASLRSVVRSRAGKTPGRGNQDYWNGDVPWVTAKDLKSHRLNGSIDRITSKAVTDGAPIALPGDVLILVRGMTLLKNVPVGLVTRHASFNQDVRCLHPSSRLRGEYLAYLLAAAKEPLRALVTHAGHGTGRLDSEQLLNLVIQVPPLLVQDWLVERLDLVNRAIQTIGALITAKRAFKLALMEDLLTGRRRFPRFGSGRWVRRPLSASFSEKSVRNRQRKIELVYSCSKLYGILPQSDRFKHRVAALDVSNYKVVLPGDLVFDPMLLWDASIGFVPEGPAGVVSPAYSTLTLDESKGALRYFAHALQSHYARHMYRIKSRGTNVRRKKLLVSDFLAIALPMPPSLEEQVAIGVFLDTCDAEIRLLEAQSAQYMHLKHGLMQRLLSGDLELPADLVETAEAAAPGSRA